jgi:fucose permease
LSERFATFVALLGQAGLGISVFKIGGLALIGDVSASTSSHTRFMNTVEACFAVGAIAGPAIVAILIGAGMSWKWLYVCAALICAALVAIASLVRYPQATRSTERADLRQMVAVLKDPLALGVCALVILYVAVEVAVYVWMPTYLLGYQGAFAWLPAYALTVFFVLRAAGRFLGAWLLARLKWTAALALSSFAIVLCFVGSLAFGVEIAAWLLPLSGLFMSIVYPTLNSKGISLFPKSQHGAAAGVILFFTAAAAALGPLAMGAVSDVHGTARAGFVLAAVFACLLCVGLLGNWILDPASHRLQTSDREDYGGAAAHDSSTAYAPAEPAQ